MMRKHVQHLLSATSGTTACLCDRHHSAADIDEITNFGLTGTQAVAWHNPGISSQLTQIHVGLSC